MGRARYARQSLGDELYSTVTQARVLLVGAGGIGCELLKDLVLTGFGEVHVVDLDTIDLSNLNRQFLFRHDHIKKSKALVARDTAARFNHNVKIEAHHSNIKDPEFNIDWFASFAVVFNALDNLDARRHVNKMCLAADVPLIESGTTGFNGQVQVIKKGKTECYDCNVKETPKSFAVCTIRSTPSQPIHCIVWAKSYLFAELFGTSEDEQPELDHTEDQENAEEIENLREEAQALKRVRSSMGSEAFPKLVFEKVFKQDIDRLRSMRDMWKSRKPPEALNYASILQDALGVGPEVRQNDQVVWTLAENFAVFTHSLKRLSDRLDEMRASNEVGNAVPILSFDKDDKDTLDFVASAANLRSIAFGIETRSEFDIKQMAGNIIPAIATTNAMTAGLCVLQAFKVLKNRLDEAKMVFLVRSTERVISCEALRPPNPDCPVCGAVQTRVVVDPERATLNNLVKDVLQHALGYSDELSISSDSGMLYDPDFEDNLEKKFHELGLTSDSFVTVVDEEDIEQPRVNLVLSLSKRTLPEGIAPIIIPEGVEVARRPRSKGIDEHEHLIATTNGTNPAAPGVKRKRKAEDIDPEDELLRKRGKVMETDTAVLLQDGDNGAIVID